MNSLLFLDPPLNSFPLFLPETLSCFVILCSHSMRQLRGIAHQSSPNGQKRLHLNHRCTRFPFECPVTLFLGWICLFCSLLLGEEALCFPPPCDERRSRSHHVTVPKGEERGGLAFTCTGCPSRGNISVSLIGTYIEGLSF